MEIGDWICNACDKHNYKYRKICFSCAKPKDVKLEPNRARDWDCVCGERNFANRDRCRKCPLKRDGTPVFKDWICPNTSCAENNFQNRNVCRKCNGPKEPLIAPEVKQIASNNDCVICLERPKTHMITKCRHFCCCDVCGFAMRACPICRCEYNPDTDLIQIYNV